MVLNNSEFKWRVMVLLLTLQALAVLDIERGHVVDATFYKHFYKIRRPYGYGSRPVNRPYGNQQGFVKRPTRPDEEYQYGPDEIPFIYYS
ncbi:hypothetical protein GHT06_012269 [Daphnia sinensis]|uniref:Uncharacterized protein n=1 Tax=Daphnia sinensis TaxID=1820382 RepID=A0AAD5PX19_9CRUS|nr:hypothetical protein GHT06_012269 [Daphnia sinensis]